MRTATLLFALLLAAGLLAADEPKPDAPVAKPAENAAPKAKKLMGIPEIPEGVSIEDGVKLQSAWAKAQNDEAYQAASSNSKDSDEKPKEGGKKKKGEAKGPKSALSSKDEALAKAMIKADPSLKPELVRTFLEASHQKAGMKKKDK